MKFERISIEKKSVPSWKDENKIQRYNLDGNLGFSN
jgi:hypothetical protein